MNRMEIIELIKATQPQQQAVTVNVPPISVPQPMVNIGEIKLPEQKAPVVNITQKAQEMRPPDVVVNVAPPAVKVDNHIKIPKTKKVNIMRDDMGKMCGIDVEKE